MNTPASDGTPSSNSLDLRQWPARAYRVTAAVWLLSLIATLLAQFHPRTDDAVRTITTSLSVLLSMAVPVTYYCLYSCRSRAVRVGLLLVPLCLVVLLLILYKPVDVTGSLVPRFKSRWAVEKVRLPKTEAADALQAAPVADLQNVTADDFPQFLGPNRDQKVTGVTLATNWQENPPELVWRQPIGAGWSSFAAVHGFAVTQEQRGDQETVTCYEIATGKLIWANGLTARHETFLGGVGPRSTPTVHDGRVYVLGATGNFRCLQGSDGKELWRHDLRAEFRLGDDAGVAWGRAPSPLIVDDLVVLPVGGRAPSAVSLVAWDRVSGERRWSTGDRETGYASPTLATLHGVRQILAVLEDQLIGVQPETGKILWSYDWPGSSTANANVTNAQPVDGERVFLSKGYTQGAVLLQTKVQPEGTWEVSEVWRIQSVMKTKFSNVVVHEGHIYGLDDVMLECIEIETGKKRWKRGRYGFGQVLLVGKTLLVQGEDGQITAVAASPESGEPLGQFTALESKTWNNPCVFGPFLLVRNSEEAACYRLPGWKPTRSVEAK